MNTLHSYGLGNARTKFCCIATIMITASSCATQAPYQEWTAQGYLTPGPTGNPEIIGVFDNERECIAAGQAWMSRQVVGNAIFADCLPVDRN